MPDLFLDNREREFIDMDIVHDVAVAERMDGELMELAAFGIRAVFPI